MKMKMNMKMNSLFNLAMYEKKNLNLNCFEVN